MTTFLSLLCGLFDTAMAPLIGLPPLVSLTVLAALTGIAVLMVYKAASDQAGLAAVKRQMRARLLEIRLFNDDLRAILRALLGILRYNLVYLRLSIVPLLWMVAPFVLLLPQLQAYYGYRGLEPDEPALLRVELRDGWRSDAGDSRPQVALEAPSGLRVEVGPVWIPSLAELNWQISAREWGRYALLVKAGGHTYTKEVQVSDQVVRRSPARLGTGLANQLLHPSEVPLPVSGPLEAIYLSYPPGDVGIAGWDWELTWMAGFFSLSAVFALALRKRLQVTF